MPLAPHVLRAALDRISIFRSGVGDEPLTCPACSAAGVKLTDASARPHAEWYLIKCEKCGLDEQVHIPLSSTSWTPLE